MPLVNLDGYDGPEPSLEGALKEFFLASAYFWDLKEKKIFWHKKDWCSPILELFSLPWTQIPNVGSACDGGGHSQKEYYGQHWPCKCLLIMLGIYRPLQPTAIKLYIAGPVNKWVYRAFTYLLIHFCKEVLACFYSPSANPNYWSWVNI